MHPPLMHTRHGGSTEASAHPHYSPTQAPPYTGSSHCFEDPSIVHWLQSAGLQHLAAPLSAAAVDHRLLPRALAQDHAGNATQSPEDRQKFPKVGKAVTGVASNPANAMPHPVFPMPSKQSSLQPSVEGFLSSELRSNDLSPGIFDIHAIDSELLLEEVAPGWLDSCSPFVPVDERGFENENDVEYASSYSPTRTQFYPTESFSRPATADKERARDNGPAKIKVVVRKRPINKKELSRNEEDIICVARNGGSLTVHEPKVKVDLTAYVEKHEFVFDAVLDEDVSNDEVYHVTVEPIIPTIFERTKATCFAYGQTGSGKTYTMQPLPIKASEAILHMMQQPQYRNQGYQLWLSFFEIYGGKLFDLLNERSKLCMREDGRQQVCIVGLKEFRVLELNMLRDYIERGSAARSTGMTGANEESSRSHAILQLSLKRNSDGNESKPARMVGKISFIDLAGSERGADTTDNDRQTRLEGAEINKSLLALKECIRALDSDQGHIPFRGSKLTEVLRDSFVGDSRTVMISCISPSAGSCEHTLNTLRYADRVKGLSRNNNSKKDPLGPLPSQREFCPAPIMPSHLQRPPSNNEGNFVSEETSQSGRQNLGSSREHCLGSVRLPYSSEDALQTVQQNFGADRLFSTSHYDSEFCKAENCREFMGRDEDAFTGTAGVQGGFLDNRQHDKHNTCQQPSRLRFTKEGGLGVQRLPTPKDSAQELKPRVFSIPNLMSNHAGQPQLRVNDRMSALLKEEDDLVTAHCKELEDTIDIVREEMKLLSEVDQPGGQISLYVTQLSKVLSKKAAGLVNLQAQLARFQQLLKEQEIVALNAGLQPA